MTCVLYVMIIIQSLYVVQSFLLHRRLFRSNDVCRYLQQDSKGNGYFQPRARCTFSTRRRCVICPSTKDGSFRHDLSTLADEHLDTDIDLSESKLDVDDSGIWSPTSYHQDIIQTGASQALKRANQPAGIETQTETDRERESRAHAHTHTHMQKQPHPH